MAKRERCALIGMILGLATIPLAYPWPLGLVFASLAVGFSLAGLKSKKRVWAIIGLIPSLAFLLLMAYLTVNLFAILTPPLPGFLWPCKGGEGVGAPGG